MPRRPGDSDILLEDEEIQKCERFLCQELGKLNYFGYTDLRAERGKSERERDKQTQRERESGRARRRMRES